MYVMEFDISTDTQASGVDASQLHEEIDDDGPYLFASFLGVRLYEDDSDDLDLLFDIEPSPFEQYSIRIVVSGHDGVGLGEDPVRSSPIAIVGQGILPVLTNIGNIIFPGSDVEELVGIQALVSVTGGIGNITIYDITNSNTIAGVFFTNTNLVIVDLGELSNIPASFSNWEVRTAAGLETVTCEGIILLYGT